MLEDLDVPGAVHRLDREDALVRCAREVHVLAELLEVTRLLPEADIHHLRGAYFGERGGLALAHVTDQRLENDPTFWMPEDRTGRLLLEVKQVLFLADAPVIALFGLFQPMQISLE